MTPACLLQVHIAEADLEVSTNYLHQSSQPGSLLLNPSHASDVPVFLRQPLLRGAGIEQNLIPVEQARIEARRAELVLQLVAMSIMSGTEFAYRDLAYANEIRKVTDASLEVAEKLLEANQERERVGLATNIEVLQARVFVATNQEGVISADALIKNSQDFLIRQMGLVDYPDAFVEVDTLPDLSTEETGHPTAWPTILAHSPDYQQQALMFSIPRGQRRDKAIQQQTENNLRRQKIILEDFRREIQVLNRTSPKTIAPRPPHKNQL